MSLWIDPYCLFPLVLICLSLVESRRENSYVSQSLKFFGVRRLPKGSDVPTLEQPVKMINHREADRP